MIKHFKYFKGFSRTAIEVRFINADNFDILGLRRSLGRLIDLHMPNSAAEIKSDLEHCALRKREGPVNPVEFIEGEHLEFMDYYNYYLEIENCSFVDSFLITYYALYLVDEIDDQDHWIHMCVNDLKDCLEDQFLPF